MDYRGLMRMKLLADTYDKMSDEDKRTFVQLTMQGKDHNEIIEALNRQHQQISHIEEKVGKQNWLTDFGSDVAANFLTDGLIWLGTRLFRKL